MIKSQRRRNDVSYAQKLSARKRSPLQLYGTIAKNVLTNIYQSEELYLCYGRDYTLPNDMFSIENR